MKIGLGSYVAEQKANIGGEQYMRKSINYILGIALSCCIVVVLFGCDQAYTIRRMSGEPVISVELIYYDNPEARNNPGEAFPLDLEKLEVLEVLDSSMIESFVDKFHISALGGLDRQTLFSHDGIGVRFIHEDGSFEIITLTTVNGRERFFMRLYDSVGNVIRTIDMAGDISMGHSTGDRLFDRFNDLLDEYFTVRSN